MNDTTADTICIQMYFFLHLLEHWFGQKPGRIHTNRTVIARREIIYFRLGPFTPK